MVGVSGCDSWLAVDNPNQIAGSDTELPVAAEGLANGAMATVMQGYSNILTAYSTVTDELDWVGSRDAFQQLDFGNMDNPYNEFTDDEFRFIAQGRWMADYAVGIMEAHDANGDLADRTNLARAYVYSAVAYIIIADMFDDFVVESDRQTAAPPVGEANMGGLYDLAITKLTSAMAIATAEGDADLATAAQALRARAHHAKAVWGLVGQRPISTGTVSSASAVADAQAVIADVADSDWNYGFQYSGSTIGSTIASWVNSRQEMKQGARYATQDGTKPTISGFHLEDLIDAGTVSPILEVLGDEFHDNFYPFAPLVSEREMYLIIAEDALTGGNMAGFETAINNLRGLDGLTDFANGGAGMPTALALLNHSRMTNLYLQGRRLADMYRFNDPDPMWDAGSTAVTAPGTFLPITVIECRANEHINDSC